MSKLKLTKDAARQSGTWVPVRETGGIPAKPEVVPQGVHDDRPADDRQGTGQLNGVIRDAQSNIPAS